MADESQRTSSSGAPPFRYTAELAGQIELRWQAAWDEKEVYRQPNPGEPGFDAGRPKFYCLDMFPYPSGAGLHVGHPEGYTATDIISRYKRMTGHNVLHPMGWDAFGLPAEQYAIQTGIHPAETTAKAIDNFRRQLQRFGFSYDWSREFGTIDEDYYRWTQWIFLKLYNAWFDPFASKARPIDDLIAQLDAGTLQIDASGKLARADQRDSLGPVSGHPVEHHRWYELSAADRRAFIDDQRLAYIAEQTVNWCPKLGTALANEEVIDGRSERGGHPVLRQPLRQWMFRITAYAERLLRSLDELDWPDSTKAMQSQWIGRSEGAEIDFELPEPVGGLTFLRVFTTRPDTIFGATYMVVAPEHPLVEAALEDPQRIIRAGADAEKLAAYAEAARNRSDQERQENKDKTGAFTGVFAVNPATGEQIPVWTSDYVLMGYGFGAIMAVPAHDQRDFEFAEAFGLAIVDVVYDRATAAMAYFAEHASDEDRHPQRWAARLADFMGLIVSEGVPLDRFAESLDIVRSRRQADDSGTAIEFDPDSHRTDAPGETGERRGVVRIGYLDAIESLGFDSFAELRQRFLSRQFHARSGYAYASPGLAWHSRGDGILLDGLLTEHAKSLAIAWLTERGFGRSKINYKLRDWLFSRQRYWGEPFPIVFDEEGNHHAVDESHLPVRLPPLADYQPVESVVPVPLLAKATDWVKTTAAEAGVSALDADAIVLRETNTMPGWAGSCWYHLRYADAHNSERFIGTEAERYWLGNGVDLYIGGAEHAVLHLLYARFWHKVLFDLGYVSSDEPYRKLFHQGMILSHAYQRKDRSLVPIDEVDAPEDGRPIERATGEPVTQIVAKMSKSLRNVINPDDVIGEFGADTFRLYEMYMGPLEQSKPWNTRDIGGLFRFCQRLWRTLINEETGALMLAEPAGQDADLEKLLHRTTAKIADDIEKLSFNTAIAAAIELVNAATTAREKHGTLFTRAQGLRLAAIVSPMMPHLAEELWNKLEGRANTGVEFCCQANWPAVDASLLTDDEVEIPVQISGKVRHRLLVPAGADPKSLEAIALGDAKVRELIGSAPPRKVIVVPGRMINIIPG